MSTNCLKCKTQILHPGEMAPNAPLGLSINGPKLQKSEDKEYYVCPSCGAKNGISYCTENGLTKSEITHLIDQD